jgi:hypothetical protein
LCRGGGRRGRDCGSAGLIDPRENGIDADRLSFLHEDLGQGTRGRGGNLGVDLVGRDLEERLVALQLIANLLRPFRQGALDDTFAHLGHYDIDHSNSPNQL